MLLAACGEIRKGGEQGSKDEDAVVNAPADPAFHALSQSLTGYDDLDPVISARTAQAFRQLFPQLAAGFAPLATLAKQNAKADALLTAASAAGYREAALAIVAAWYTGTVGNGQAAKSIAYADALMNRPVADALFPPTYQLGGPAWWTAAPPPVDHPDAAALKQGIQTLAAQTLAGKKKA
jgi:hypothetical protein